MMNPALKGTVLVLAAASLWGLSGVFAQYIFHNKFVSPEWLVTLRMLIPGVLLIGIRFMQKGKSVFNVWKHDAPKMLIFGLVGMLTVQFTFFQTIKYSNAATATVLQFINPAIIILYLAVKNKALPSIATMVAVMLSLVGVFLVATHGSFTSLSISPKALGWGLFSATATSFYVLYSIEIIRKWGVYDVLGWAMLTGGVFLSIFYPPWQVSGIWDGLTFVSAFYIIIFGSLVTFLLFLNGVQYVGGTKAGVLSCTEPLSAAVFSVFFLHINFGVMDILGTGLIMLAVILLSFVKNSG